MRKCFIFCKLSSLPTKTVGWCTEWSLSGDLIMNHFWEICKEYFSIFEQVIRYNLVCGSLCLVNREAIHEKRKPFQTRLYKYNLLKNFKYPYHLIFTTKFKDSSIYSWDYLNLSFVNDYIGDVTLPTQAIKYNKCCSRRISQSDCSIHDKLNHCQMKNEIYVESINNHTIEQMYSLIKKSFEQRTGNP
jgi:hypothetical protein